LIGSIIDRAGHVCSVLEPLFEVAQAARLGILTRRNALEPLKGPLEMVGTQMKLLAQIGQMQRSIQVRFNKAGNLLDELLPLTSTIRWREILPICERFLGSVRRECLDGI
jgi:hypothetical protein